MKKLLLALLAVSSLANAKGVAFFNNQAGGKVVITDEVCKNKEGKVYEGLWRAYMYTSSGETDEGCFYVEDDVVRLSWAGSGNERKYPLNIFTLYEKQKTSKPKPTL